MAYSNQRCAINQEQGLIPQIYLTLQKQVDKQHPTHASRASGTLSIPGMSTSTQGSSTNIIDNANLEPV